ncbi:aminotransferase class I/II-fold pyridoxal phosphate-dependent enzyme [Clostridium massiliamazoniense]|uniref:aminotransferase class I/II-fold pyridoxal phosphate-dependent enzyme n=1 Tax=Clostridium massiliamazoniense TaxID=1347366 RepID=UPI0006D78EE7|nr:aminotransferase class I/II-fold pyridoxal phosphate-dependent enzyme [Clostridium massiliamazoniense]
MIVENMILENIKNMPPSGIRKYFDLINEMEDVISLGVGEPDFVTPWNIIEAGVYSLEQGHTHYSSNAGFVELREEISNYMNRRFLLKYKPENEILVTVGGSEAIDLALRALVGPGDEVIIPEPSFVAYKGCTTFTGAKAVTIELLQENDFKLTAEALEKAITKKTKVVIIPFPNNPTGSIMTREDLIPIVEVLKDKNIIVLSDEIYAELSYDKGHVSIASFEEMYEKTIVINGFSKAYAMTGWRLGYACGNKAIIEAMKKIHQYAIMCSPTTAQYAAIEALKNGDDSVSEMAREYNRRRRYILNSFREMGLECFEALGALYVFPCIKSTGMTSDEFCEKLLLEEKVLAVPGNAFGECGEGFIRACYAASMDDIIEAMKRIKKFIEKYK